MEYDESDAEYFEFIQQKPLLDTIHESTSFHSDQSHHSHHRRYYRHTHDYDRNHQNHPHQKKLQLIKFLSLFILQYALVSFLFQYQFNLRHPPSLPPDSIQVDDDDYMHQSFVQSRSTNPKPTTVADVASVQRRADIIPVKDNSAHANDVTGPPMNDTTTTSSKDKPMKVEKKEPPKTVPPSKTTAPTAQETRTPSVSSKKSLRKEEKVKQAVPKEEPVEEPTAKAQPFNEQKKKHPPTVPLNLIPKQEMNFYDYFSDSWLIPKENFMQLNTTSMDHVEQACFQAVRRPGYYVHPTSKMFVDWTDFMVEHMSKWWGVFRIAKDPDATMFNHVIEIFDKYLMKQATAYNDKIKVEEDETTSLPPLHRTLAMVAFREYTTNLQPERGPLLSSHVLAATLASLIPMGYGRILLTGYDPDDRTRVYEALQILEASYKGAMLKRPRNSNTFSLQIGPTELAYAKIPHEKWVKTNAYEVNVPRGAIHGVQQAITGGMNSPHAQEWLGVQHNASYWKYFYLTEPDTILHTKPKLLASIQEGLDRGLSFFPHRLQPIPHERDLPDMKLHKAKEETWKLPFEAGGEPEELKEAQNSQDAQKHFSDRYAGMYLPGNIEPFSNVTVLDSLNNPNEYHCCDGGKGWPGRSPDFGKGTGQKPCNGRSWWACGLVGMSRHAPTKEQQLKRHERLLGYPLMSLEQGTGVVFGPTNAGRRCFPSKTACPPREMHVLLPKSVLKGNGGGGGESKNNEKK